MRIRIAGAWYAGRWPAAARQVIHGLLDGEALKDRLREIGGLPVETVEKVEHRITAGGVALVTRRKVDLDLLIRRIAEEVLLQGRRVKADRKVSRHRRLRSGNARSQRMVETDEWKKDIETNHLAAEYLGSANLRKLMDRDYAQVNAFLTELELVK